MRGRPQQKVQRSAQHNNHRKMHMLHQLTNWCLPVKHKVDKKIEQPDLSTP
ncbi:unnamed protein product [Ectocarpus sp. CCAP 1310/34]|nr:unnamed protein product [Ectocarpus sp. CCAP 1310/34]